MEEILKKIEQFHGHIGPYVIIGYKMGQISKNILGKDPFSKKAIVWTGNETPLSCIIDGIQLSSGCTLGKGNLIVKNEKIPKVQFITKEGKNLDIILKKDIQNEIETKVNMENISEYSRIIYKKSNHELFEII